MAILCMGEPLLRLSTPAHERLEDAHSLDVSFCGAEVVVASALARLGQPTAFASRVCDSHLGRAALMSLSRYGVDVSRVTKEPGRMGIYYSERGRSIRSSVVTYDREGTPLARAKCSDFDWDSILNGVTVMFFSGVLPAISPTMHEVCLEGLKACKGRGIPVVMDLNYRTTMWPSHEIAVEKIEVILPYVDTLIASEDDILSYSGQESVPPVELFAYCQTWAQTMREKFDLKSVGFVVRLVEYNDQATIQGGYITKDAEYIGREQHVVMSDISSTGSIFAASLLHGMLSSWDMTFSVNYATMSSAFTATIFGDYSIPAESEITELLLGYTPPHIRQ